MSADDSSKTGSAGAKPSPSFSEILKKAGDRALQGGTAGAMAMFINTLYKEGGIPRFYRGLAPALIQGPMSRFGDVAANAGALALFDSMEQTKDLPIWVKTGGASLSSALFRIFLMPVDTFKTTMQVQGKDGVANLMAKARAKGPSVFYHGSLAAATATAVGHYPWFTVFNTLQEKIPQQDTAAMKLVRNAGIGFTATCVSDTLSNSIRVIKVYKQSNTEAVSYPEAAKRVIAEDGLIGLFGRGLKTKIIANGCQGMVFSVLMKLIDEKLSGKK
eukprot:GSChrysophyteH1.ASY1.ANO1.2181.1 assembled CDS